MTKRLYTVKPGESLSIIARDRLGELQRWKELAFINSIEYPYIIRPGQVIQLPNDTDEIVIENNQRANQPAGATATRRRFEVTPATLAVLVVVAAVLFLGRKA